MIPVYISIAKWVLSLFCYTTLTCECRCHHQKNVMAALSSQKRPRVPWFQCPHPAVHFAIPGLFHPNAGVNRAPSLLSHPALATGQDVAALPLTSHQTQRLSQVVSRAWIHISALWEQISTFPGHCVLWNIKQHLFVACWESTSMAIHSLFGLVWTFFLCLLKATCIVFMSLDKLCAQ